MRPFIAAAGHCQRCSFFGCNVRNFLYIKIVHSAGPRIFWQSCCCTIHTSFIFGSPQTNGVNLYRNSKSVSIQYFSQFNIDPPTYTTSKINPSSYRCFSVSDFILTFMQTPDLECNVPKAFACTEQMSQCGTGGFLKSEE